MPIDAFTGHPLVHGLSSEEMRRLAELLERVEFIGDERLCTEGVASSGLLLINAGLLVVSQKVSGSREDVTICELAAPTIVGEMELLTGRASVCTVAARQPAVGWRLPSLTFRRLVMEGDESAAQLIRNIAQVLVSRLIEANRRYLAEAHPGAHSTIAEALTGCWEQVRGD